MHPRTLIVILAVFFTFALLVVGGAILVESRLSRALSFRLPGPGPTPTPKIVTGAAVIRQMQAMQRLETTRYTVETVVEASTPDGWISRGERLLLIAHGGVIVGFDLSKLRPEDVQVSADGKSIKITLPPAEVLSTGLDEEKTRIYSRTSGRYVGILPKSGDPNLETEARRRGAQQILQSACEDGIMKRANEDGTIAVRNLLTLTGFEIVEVQTREPAPGACAAPR